MKLYSIHISDFKIDGGAMFGVVPKVLWQRNYPADENNLCTWALRALLVDTGERVILIDNGCGDKQSEKFFSHLHISGGKGIERGLKEHGYTVDDVTDMLLTHLHFDHCGGGVKWNEQRTGYELTFPNATYWVSRKQWEWALNPNVREGDSYLEENLIPMMESGQLKFIDEDTELYDGIKVRLYDGHTAGQLIPFIDYKDRTIVYTADLIPSSAHLNIKYNMAYDIEPLKTFVEKESFLEEAVANNYLLFFEHDHYHECCSVKRSGNKVTADRSFTLKEI